ncbi:MAG: VanZ family protein [Calditrichia bacterium]
MNKRIISVLFYIFIFLTLYNTLIPFQFDYGFADLPDQISKISLPDLSDLPLTDIVGNILLFMPFGFLGFVFLQQRGFGNALLLIGAAGFALSLFIEFVQLFIMNRNTAPHDLFNNSLGTLIGATGAAIYAGQIGTHARNALLELYRKQPYALIPVLIALAQSVAAIMPFTVSITVSSLKKSLKSTNIVPFDYQSFGKLFLGYPNRQDDLPFDFTAMIEDVLFWSAIGYVFYMCYRLYWQSNSKGKWLLIGAPLLFFPMLEFGQLFITKRFTDINDIISGYSGVALGCFMASRMLPQQNPLKPALELLKTPLIIYTAFILFSGLRPFDWSLASEVLAKDLFAENLIPFYAYFRKTSLWNIYDLVNSLTFLLPISLYWTYQLRKSGSAFGGIYMKTFLAGLAVGAFIEFTQLLSFSRIAEITDVLAYAGGGALGTFMIYYYEQQIIPLLSSNESVG